MAQVEKQLTEIKTHGGRRQGSGRPAGALNKITQPIRELASAFGEDAIKTLVHLMDNAKQEQVRLAASNSLLDRGFGRPANEQAPKKEITVNVRR